MQARCNFCGSALCGQKYKIEHPYSHFDIYECPDCKLLFQNPLPDKKSLLKMYQEDYYTGSSSFSYEDERKAFPAYSKVWKKRVLKLKKNLKTQALKPKILDIGSSFGGLLENALGAGFDPYGIEISDYSRQYSETLLGKGKVFPDLKEASFQDSFFDAVSMIEVIEHLDNPSESLEEVYRILKKGGVFLIQTANMEGLQAKKLKEKYHYFLPGHLYYFSRQNLREKLFKIGFQKIKFFHPVEFGLLPKLQKSKAGFHSCKDYWKWKNIISYHLKSLFHWNDFCLTSSMAVYAWK
ncbi:MAG TPA: class I SAM-dependent methyltransferase [Spirochaetia bacterium]|nr:MAG: hypothetical protein A2Y41_09655 [Spirochaetes bacterium GWB1_36_13]HCL56546.1 class I SAM-dependent methyltransferase [Spirochaetia bacterium]